MAIKHKELRGAIISKYGTYTDFAEDIGVSGNTVSRKLNDKVSFSREDIELWSEKLDIPLVKVGLYFFGTRV